MESKEYHHITLLNCNINTGFKVASTASVCVDIEGEELQGTGSGNGGFDAFMDAITNILKTRDFIMPALVDYEVHIPRGGQTDALTECIITWQSGERDFKPVGLIQSGDGSGEGHAQDGQSETPQYLSQSLLSSSATRSPNPSVLIILTSLPGFERSGVEKP